MEKTVFYYKLPFFYYKHKPFFFSDVSCDLAEKNKLNGFQTANGEVNVEPVLLDTLLDHILTLGMLFFQF